MSEIVTIILSAVMLMMLTAFGIVINGLLKRNRKLEKELEDLRDKL